ncbi:BTAD domain-containing putative transcriptional regulator [Actinomycetospora sp. C-140]
MTRVEVRVLGPVRVLVDGVEVDVGGPMRRALLARLAVAQGGVVSTDRLVEDLWRGEPPPRAVAALQAHVSHLRRLLEPDRAPRAAATVLVSVPPGYALRARLDLTAMTELPGTDDPAELARALDAWDGPAFGEFADEAWAAPAVARLDTRRAELVRRLGAAELAAGDPAAAERRLAAHVDEHPLDEDAVLLLARARYRGGRQADALALIATTRRRLADDLGLDPSPALRRLETALLTQDPELEPAPAPSPLTAPPDLLGRDGELGRLRTTAGRVASGPGELALIGGEPGAGKSTLLDALGGELGAGGWRTIRGRCPEVDGAPPAWAWTEVAAALGVDLPEDDPFRAGRALVAALREAARERSVLVVLDDLHRGDDATARLLRAVAGEGVERVLVVGAYRPAEVDDDLDAAIAALVAVTGERLELGGLAPDACAALVARHGGPAALDADAARRLEDRTGGNPLFVREIARWWAGGGDGAVPAGVRDVLRRRVAALPAATGAVLRHAAVLGRDVDVGVLVELEQGDVDRVLDALSAAVDAGLLEETGPDGVRFDHDLVREVLYDDVPALRRGRVHARVLAVLSDRRPGDHGALAHHALAAGSSVDAVRVLDHVEAAAARARRQDAPRAAADLLAAALDRRDVTDGTAVDPTRRVALRAAHAAAAAHAGSTVEAVRSRRRAIEEADTRQLLTTAVTCLDAPVSFSLSEGGEPDDAVVAAVDRLLDGPAAPADRVRLLAARTFARPPEHAADDAEAAVAALAEVPDGTALRPVALNARFWGLLVPERWDALDALGRELLEAAGRAGSWGHRTVGHHARFLHACHRHELDAARSHARAALAEAPTGQLAATLEWSAIFDAVALLVAGHPDEAERAYEAAAAGMAARGLANGEALRLAGLLGVRRVQGRLGELVAPLAALHGAFGAVVADPYARALLAAGRPADARAVWRPEVPVRRDWWWTLWTAMRAEVAVGLGDRDVAARCHDDLAPWAGRMAGLMSGTATFGPVDGVLADLGVLLGHPDDDVARHRAAAAALGARLGSPPWPAA